VKHLFSQTRAVLHHISLSEATLSEVMLDTKIELRTFYTLSLQDVSRVIVEPCCPGGAPVLSLMLLLNTVRLDTGSITHGQRSF
jgi:hypothetical protein